MHLNFSNANLKVEYHYDELLWMTGTAANICDSTGDPIIWTNGMQIFGKKGIEIAHRIAYDSDPISYWNYYSDHGEGPIGFPLPDGAVILPFPLSPNYYFVIYHYSEVHPDGYFQVTKFLSALIKVNNNLTYDLIYQDSIIGPYKHWLASKICATKHANGRDWWITTFDANSPHYYSFLLDPNGIQLDHEGNVDEIVKEGLGQVEFSSQGNYFARLDAITLDEGQYVTLFRFDRCSGDFERLNTFHTDAGATTGVSFSPSERYLYADDNSHLWQWDLLSSDIAASQVLVDTFDGFIQPNWFGMYFGPMASATDGKIYIIPPAGSSKYMHVIERPDLPSPDCRFTQHSVYLEKSNGRSAPNIPNFRLGPIDGSPCDTLGIDNHPIARWKYEEDLPGIWKTIRFIDLSFYNPTSWHWDFGNGSTSDEANPVHTYEPGLYQVCLTVSNSFSSDSTCHWVNILSTNVNHENELSDDLTFLPNPFHSEINIQSQSEFSQEVKITLFDILGKPVFKKSSILVPGKFNIPELTNGLYFLVIEDQNGHFYTVKMMKI